MSSYLVLVMSGGSEEGSTGSVTTPYERERIAMEGATDEEQVERILRGLMSDAKFKSELDAVKGDRKALAATFREAIEGHQRITQGRDAIEMSPQEYLKELLEARPDVVDGIEIWTSKNVVIADLVVGSLLKQLRDLGYSWS